MGKTLAVLLLLATLILPAGRAAALEVDHDLLALVAMPLAVAAVSEIADVPVSDLMDFVSLLNDAAVPPPQFIEVVRYVPVALVVEYDDPQLRFVEVVRAQERTGVRGLALVTFIEQRLNTYGLPSTIDFEVTAPRVYVVDHDFVPPVVRTRVAYLRTHPHGGPPGQLKKQRGLQTGAEVVHGSRDRHNRGDRDVTTRVVTTRIADDREKKTKTKIIKPSDVDQQHRVIVKEKQKKQHVEKHEGQGSDHANGKGKNKGKGKG